MKGPEATPLKSAEGGEEEQDRKKRRGGGGGTLGLLDGFSPVSPPRIFWNSRRRSMNGQIFNRAMEEVTGNRNVSDISGNNSNSRSGEKDGTKEATEGNEETRETMEEPHLSDRRRALFQPLKPSEGKRLRAEDLLPPPDFDVVMHPKGWLVGKKRKLVNVDVVENMRRIAVHEMNRKDEEIDGLNEQLEEDGQYLERLQVQLLEERSKRANVEREKAVLENQVTMLMDMLHEADAMEGEEDEPHK